MLSTASPIDALIIGCGWSGLTSALQLTKAGKKVLCLEARQRLGGRAFTHSWNEDTAMDNNDRNVSASASNEKGTYVVDFGCSYIHGYEEGNPVKEIAKKYGVVSYLWL
jgi:monoamine oxidase